ncbi:MAG TPA: HemK2/MTQ2 family protein methyltransferase [Solirubrobacteraceae bacterium]
MRLLTPPGVFAPISDSRFLADVLREQTLPPRATVLDLCTGSGILAITAARRGARSVTAVDCSRRAVWTARLNARLNGVRVRGLRGDLFEPVNGQRFDAIVSNPPYVPAETDELPAKGLERAWDAGTDGRALLDRIIEEAPDHLKPGGFLLLVSSSVLGTDLTLQAMRDAGLEDVDVVARQRGPLGPLMSARVHTLEERGMLKPGQRHEDMIIVRGRRPEREGWRLPTDAELAASA